MKRKEKIVFDSRKIAITATYVTVVILLDLLDFGQYLMLFGVKPTILLIPVIMAAQNEDVITAFIAGTAFGLLSFIKNFTMPGLFVNFFYNPLISILPRMLIPITAYLVFKRLKNKNFYLAAIISTLVGVVTNTGLVLGSVLLWSGAVPAPTAVGDTWLKVVAAILSFNFPIELLFCLVVIPAATFAMHKARRIPITVSTHTSENNAAHAAPHSPVAAVAAEPAPEPAASEVVPDTAPEPAAPEVAPDTAPEPAAPDTAPDTAPEPALDTPAPEPAPDSTHEEDTSAISD